jgi:DNA repair protein RadC
MTRGVVLAPVEIDPSSSPTTDDDVDLLARALDLPRDGRLASLSERLVAVGGLHALFWSGTESLEGLIERDQVLRLETMLQLAARILAPRALPEQIDDARDVAAFFQPRLATEKQESFWVLSLDSRGRPAALACAAKGTLTSCMVHPREVFAPAIRARAASVIVVHNHPSGEPAPSEEDEELTRRLTEAGCILGIPVVDHVIVAREGFRSLGQPQRSLRSDSAPDRSSARRGVRTWKT